MMYDLRSAKVGDRIMCRSAYSIREYDLYTVTRLTKTLAVCGDVSFRLRGGVMQGTAGNWSTRYGELVSDADIAKFEAVKIMRQRILRVRETIRSIVISESNLEAAEAFIEASQARDERKGAK